MSAGSCRAIAVKPIEAIRSSYACQYPAVSSAMNSSSSAAGTPAGRRRRSEILNQPPSPPARRAQPRKVTQHYQYVTTAQAKTKQFLAERKRGDGLSTALSNG